VNRSIHESILNGGHAAALEFCDGELIIHSARLVLS
jgi:hypothetical protein